MSEKQRHRPEREVSSSDELVAAAADAQVRSITVLASLTDVPTLRLSPGQTLRATGAMETLRFAPGADGLQLTTDNHVENLALQALHRDGQLGRIRAHRHTR